MGLIDAIIIPSRETGWRDGLFPATFEKSLQIKATMAKIHPVRPQFASRLFAIHVTDEALTGLAQALREH